jgi:hypothetical protein
MWKILEELLLTLHLRYIGKPTGESQWTVNRPSLLPFGALMKMVDGCLSIVEWTSDRICHDAVTSIMLVVG